MVEAITLLATGGASLEHLRLVSSWRHLCELQNRQSLRHPSIRAQMRLFKRKESWERTVPVLTSLFWLRRRRTAVQRRHAVRSHRQHRRWDVGASCCLRIDLDRRNGAVWYWRPTRSHRL